MSSDFVTQLQASLGTAYLLERNIAKNKLPEKLVVISEMTLTPTRKIIKSRLRI